MTSWYVAKAKPRKSKLLIESLSRWGVETYYPEIRQRGRTDGKLEPLFNTYIFCKFDPKAPEWQAIRWAPGLSYFLSEAGSLAVMPDSVIDYLKQKTRRWNEGMVSKRFSPGDNVAIVDGPFAGFEAVFNGYLSSRDRCLVLLNSVSGISSVEISDLDIETAEGSWRGRFGLGAGKA